MFEATHTGESMPRGPFLQSGCRQLVVMVLAWAVCLGVVHGQVESPTSQAPTQDCRIAFDLGSSGVRVAVSGMSQGSQMPSRDIDLLTPLMQGQGFQPLLPAVESALRELPKQAKLPSTCRQLGGGFSAWRLAWRQDDAQLANHLGILREQTGVAVLIIPAVVEGRYGYDSARQALGSRLKTSHILDIGGGSMQVAGFDRSFGIELGQKSWSHQLCRTLSRDAGAACQLLPLQVLELQQARDLALQQLQALPAQVGNGTLTAISRPVTRGVRSALHGLGMAQGDVISLQELSRAIDRLSAGSLTELVALTDLPVNFAPYVVPDMLLVEAVLRAMGLTSLALAETPINNLPALLRDERAFEWARHHSCYVQRLRERGPAAYFSDPADCAKPSWP